MLAEARALTRAGRIDDALGVLDSFDRRFGSTAVLAEEALVARVLASCAGHQVARAELAAKTLARLNPRSPHLARVENACW